MQHRSSFELHRCNFKSQILRISALRYSSNPISLKFTACSSHSRVYIDLRKMNKNGTTVPISLTEIGKHVLISSHSQIDVDNIRIFTAPGKLVHSLQEVIESADKKTNGFKCTSSSICNWSPLMKYNEKGGFTHKGGDNENGNHNEQFLAESSTNGRSADIYKEEDKSASEEDVIAVEKKEKATPSSGKIRRWVPFRLMCSLFLLLLSIFTSLMWLDGQREDIHLVPT